jgi:hypothetical protein
MSDVQYMNKISGNYGSFILNGTTLITLPSSVEVNALVVGSDGATISSIRLVDKNNAVYKYRNSTNAFDWDGKTLGAGDIIDIPEGLKLYSIQLSAGYMKGILKSQPILIAV